MYKNKRLKSAFLVAAMTALASSAAYAQEPVSETTPASETQTPPKPKSEFRANFKRVALDLSSTEVSNAEEYQDSTVTALSADSKKVIKGVFDFALEYEREKMRWDNKIYLSYGKTTTKEVGVPKSTDENDDQIIFTTDYTYKLWNIKQASLGPFASAAYQTEFTENADSPRNKILRGATGLRLLNAPYVPNFYAAVIGEADFTYPTDVERYGWEIGFESSHELREGVKFKGEGYYRKYVQYSTYNGPDLRYDLSLVGRMDVAIYKKVSLSPYVQYRLAKSREAKNHGSNFMIGLSLSYADIFKIW